MTIFYPDISSFQGNINLSGAVAVCAKATEGTGWKSAYYADQKAEAAKVGAFFFAYHFLHAGNAAAQAQYCYSVVGKTPLMLDWESTSGSNPGVADAEQFIDEFRALGGKINLVYLPRWYWQQIGSPSLAGIASRGLKNVSSDYTGYSDSGPGWASYGGLTVAVWQFSSTYSFGGQSVDMNAFKGTVAEFEALVNGGTVAPVKPESLVLSDGDTGSAVQYLQQRLNVWGAKLTVDGDFGPATLAAVKAFQTAEKLSVDGVVGPVTWAALDKNPDPVSKTVAVPDVAGKSAGEAHNALVAAGLVPTAPFYQRPGDTVASTTPVAGTTVNTGSAVMINGVQYHGQYITGGMFDLADLANKLGVGVDGPATLLRMTASHYGTFGNDLGALLRDILTGAKPWNTPVPGGAQLWCD